MGWLVFIPRLELLYIENDNIVCNFLGGDNCNQKLWRRAPLDVCHPPMLHWNTTGKVEMINANRVIYMLDSTPEALEGFIFHGKVC